MSKITTKINKMKDKLDSVSGLDGDYTYKQLELLETVVNIYVSKIEKHEKENGLNGTIFESDVD